MEKSIQSAGEAGARRCSDGAAVVEEVAGVEVDAPSGLGPWAAWPLRIQLAMVAAYEIESLAVLLKKAQGVEFDQEERGVRHVLNRIVTLADAVIASLGDKSDGPHDIRERVFPDHGPEDFPDQASDVECFGSEA